VGHEPIARMANAEDQCTGRFWTDFCSCKTCISNIHVGQSRFKSQALLDEKALAACMAYVDLNPIRAEMAKTPESSERTSIKRRIETLKTDNPQPLKLSKFVGNPREPMPQGLPFHLHDYVQLVDITGRPIREDKRGFNDNNLPPILERLNIASREWLLLTTQFESKLKSLARCMEKLMLAATALGLQRRPAYANCEAILH